MRGNRFRWHPRAPNQKPEDYRQFRSLKNPSDLTDRRSIGRKQHRCEGIDYVPAASNEKQVSYEARNETRSNYQNSKRKQPKPPKDLSDENSLITQTKE